MKIIVTIIPTDLVTNSLLSFFLSFLTNQKQESDFLQVGGLVTRTISVFCLQLVALYFKAMSNSTEFYKGGFLRCYSCSYYSSMVYFNFPTISMLIKLRNISHNSGITCITNSFSIQLFSQITLTGCFLLFNE